MNAGGQVRNLARTQTFNPLLWSAISWAIPSDLCVFGPSRALQWMPSPDYGRLELSDRMVDAAAQMKV